MARSRLSPTPKRAISHRCTRVMGISLEPYRILDSRHLHRMEHLLRTFNAHLIRRILPPAVDISLVIQSTRVLGPQRNPYNSRPRRLLGTHIRIHRTVANRIVALRDGTTRRRTRSRVTRFLFRLGQGGLTATPVQTTA